MEFKILIIKESNTLSNFYMASSFCRLQWFIDFHSISFLYMLFYVHSIIIVAWFCMLSWSQIWMIRNTNLWFVKFLVIWKNGYLQPKQKQTVTQINILLMYTFSNHFNWLYLGHVLWKCLEMDLLLSIWV
jgi:hypothetical protein